MKEETKKKSKLKLVVISLLFIVLLSLVAVVLAYFRVNDMLKPVSSLGDAESQYFTIESGSSVKSVGESLQKSGLIKSSDLFYYVVRFPKLFLKKNNAVVFKSGIYELSPNMSVAQIVDMFEQGKQAFVKVSIPEGLTIRKIAKILDKSGICSFEDFILAARDVEILEKYKIPTDSCEGFLFPDTYFFYPTMKAKEVVEKMIDNFFSNLKKINGFDNATEIPYDRLVLASIVEREYRVAEEAPLIAGVFLNRINVKMGLESCATIEYIITEIQGKPHPDIITYKDLKIDSPYNTYKWASLPPTPISNPGMVALTAALNPKESDFFYFTLTDALAGTHTFSKTLKSHIKATTEFRTKKAN